MVGLAAVLLLGLVPTPAPAQTVTIEPATCARGQYRVFAAKLRTKTGVTPGDTLALGPNDATIPGLCPATAPKRFRATRKGVTKVKVRWARCDPLGGPARFAGRLVDDCARLVGTVRAKRFRWRIEASRTPFEDLSLAQRRVTGLPGGDVVLDGTLLALDGGELDGQVFATYGATGVARVVAGRGFLAVEIGDTVVDLLPADEGFVRVEALASDQRAVSVAEALAAFGEDVAAGADPAAWAPVSQAILVLTALASTPEWTRNVEASAAGGTAGAAARTAAPALASLLPSGCKTAAIALAGLASAGVVLSTTLGCTAACVDLAVIPILGQVTCAQLVAVCTALANGAFAAVYEAGLAVCAELTAPAPPTSPILIRSALCDCRVVAGGTAGTLEIDWAPSDPAQPPVQPLTTTVRAVDCPLGLTCPGGTVTRVAGPTLVLPDAVRCSGPIDAPETFRVEATVQAAEGLPAAPVSFTATCLPPCGDARAPACGGACATGTVCRPGGDGTCGCVAGDAPPCGTTGNVCTSGLCPPGQSCTHVEYFGCACAGDGATGGDDLDGAIPRDLPPGTYRLSYRITGPGGFGPVDVGEFPLRRRQADEFRRSLVETLRQVARQFAQNPNCTTSVTASPFDGAGFTVGLRLVCEDDEGTPAVIDLVFEVRKVA